MKGLAVGRLLAAYAAFVVYGSLVPLAFTPLPWAQAWAAFKDIPFFDLGVEARADWVANGVLYLPLGWLAALALLRRGRPTLAACLLGWAGCALLALVVEFAQLHFPPRTVSQNDLIAEGLGSALGVLLAPLSVAWLQRLGAAQSRSGLVGRLLGAYALAYVGFSFFPFDLLLSAAELHAKAGSDNWAWVIAHTSPFVVMKLLLEVALAAPLGLLLVQRRGRLVTPLATAAVGGALLGVLVEAGQFFIASGVSQGASVLTRAVGVALGAWVAQAGLAQRYDDGDGSLRLRVLLARWAPLWAPAWLLALLAASGLLTLSWQGPAAAAASWRDVHLLPFYYHYFTTEVLALLSLGSVLLMYLPLALLGWACAWRGRVAVAAAAALAVLVEAAKLFVAGLHPDPTNILIAAAAVAGGLRLLALADRVQQPPERVAPARWRPGVNPFVVLGLGLGLFGALFFPLAPVLMLAGLLACAALTWRWPLLPLALLPLALPIFDLAPWSGRFFWDEFDLLSAVCLAVAWHRTPAALPARQPWWMRFAFAALALSLAASSLRALWPWPGLDDNSFNNYHSAFNALRIVKGAAWAALFVVLWRRLHSHGAARGRFFAAGMVAGLALTVVAVLVERAAFVDLADFAVDYRVTGLFSAMHKGGAFIECWLAVASAFALIWVLRPRSNWQRGIAALVLAGSAYAMFVTYSRNGYAALVVVVLVTLFCAALAPRRGQNSSVLAAGLVLVLMGAVALPVLMGSFARERLATSAQDLAVRQAHWQDGLQLRDGSLTTALLGLGIGRYPQAHYWRSREPIRAATYSLGRDSTGPYLRLSTGARLYVEQIIEPILEQIPEQIGERPPPGRLKLSLRLRLAVQATAAGVVNPPTLRVALCEKWTLTSRGCVGATATVAVATEKADGWQTVEVTLNPAALPPARDGLQPPLKLALLTPELAAVDVADIRLTSPTGEPMLHNGGFADGLDHWFFSTDVDPPWQLHSLPLTVLVEQGWVGVLAWLAVLAVALTCAVRLARQGRAEVIAAPAALAGFLVCGALNTLIDAPRFLWLLLVLLWLCTRGGRPAGGRFPASAGPVSAP